MKTTHQNYQITSTLSTRQSHFQPVLLTSTPQISTVKKFMRKRQRSTDQLRRPIVGQTTALRNVVNGERQSIEKTDHHGSESTKLIPSNIKKNIPESTIHKKFIKKLQIDENLIEKQFKGDLNRSSEIIKESGPLAPKDKFKTPLCSTEKKRVNSNCSFDDLCFSPKNSGKDSRNQNYPIITCNLTNYAEPKTQRNIGKTTIKQKPNSMAEIRILQSQIMILEDQNRRLKKQVILLEGQKSRQKNLNIWLKQQNVRFLNKIEQMKQKNIQNMKYLQKQVCSIYFSLLRNYTFLYQQKDSEATLNCGSQLNQNLARNDFFLNADIFQTKFLQQYFLLIHEGLQKCREEFLRTKVCLQKVLIKQNVVQRGQYWDIRIKSESKNFISRIKRQKAKVQKLKKQCEQLSKQNDRIQKCISVKNKKQIVSERIIGRGDSEGYVSLYFSDSSDQE